MEIRLETEVEESSKKDCKDTEKEGLKECKEEYPEKEEEEDKQVEDKGKEEDEGESWLELSMAEMELLQRMEEANRFFSPFPRSLLPMFPQLDLDQADRVRQQVSGLPSILHLELQLDQLDELKCSFSVFQRVS